MALGAAAPDLPDDLAGWLELLERRHPHTIDLDLERCGAVYRAMGSPRPAPFVVTVAGTNGKGSAVAWTCALLAGLGRRTAAYTSPHLLRFNERLRLGEREVCDDELVAAFGRVEQARGDVSLTYFEFTTLACLDLMQQAAPDVAVLEVGLGGRLDTVNLVDADLVIVTPIGLDHQEYLGPDRESIGREKAGVLRPGIPVVCTEAQPPASVMARAGELGCRLLVAERHFRIAPRVGALRFEMGDARVDLPLPLLAGGHQHANLAAALAATACIVPSALSEPEALARGMRQVRLPGRLQAVAEDPRLLLDVGHNPLAAVVLAASLSARGGPAAYAVLGMLADKDAEGVTRALAGRVAHWYCAGLNGARGQSGEALAARVSSVTGATGVRAFRSVADAMAAARQDAPADAVILVFGSFQTVAEAASALNRLEPEAGEGARDR